MSKKIIVMQHYVANQVNNGGPATGALLLMSSFLKNKYQFIPLIQKYAPRGLNIKLLLSLYITIKKNKPDILHIRGLQSDGFYGVLAGKLAGCKKIVVSVHGVYTDAIAIKNLKRWIFLKILEPWTLRNADVVYCVSKVTSQRPFIKKYSKNLYGHIHNAAPDFSKYDKSEIKNTIRNNYNISASSTVAISVGRITIDKGYEVLLETIIKVRKFNNDIVFLIVGEGNYLTEMQQQIRNNSINNIIFTGKQKDIPKFLLASDIFIFPSLHENLSNALLEACEAGLAIIATNVGGNPEVIQHKKTGLLIDPNNSQELVDNLVILDNDTNLRNYLGLNAQENIRKNFSQKAIFEKMDNLYQKMLQL